MKDPKYIITGVNRLSRQRQPVCRPMGKDKALQLLSGYRHDSSHRGHKPYLRLRLERVQPVQLEINFQTTDNGKDSTPSGGSKLPK